MIDMVAMDGYAPYVWTCYGLVLFVLIYLGVSSWLKQKNLIAHAKELQAATPRRPRRDRETVKGAS